MCGGCSIKSAWNYWSCSSFIACFCDTFVAISDTALGITSKILQSLSSVLPVGVDVVAGGGARLLVVPAAISRIFTALMKRPVMSHGIVVVVVVVEAVALVAPLPPVGRSPSTPRHIVVEGDRHARVEGPHRPPPRQLVGGGRRPGRVARQVQQGVVDGGLPQDYAVP